MSGQAGLFVSRDVGWLQLLVSVDLASRAEVLTACKPSQILSCARLPGGFRNETIWIRRGMGGLLGMLGCTSLSQASRVTRPPTEIFRLGAHGPNLPPPSF